MAQSFSLLEQLEHITDKLSFIPPLQRRQMRCEEIRFKVEQLVQSIREKSSNLHASADCVEKDTNNCLVMLEN